MKQMEEQGWPFPLPRSLGRMGVEGHTFAPLEGLHCQVIPAALIAISLGLMACMLVVHPMKREQRVKRNS